MGCLPTEGRQVQFVDHEADDRGRTEHQGDIAHGQSLFEFLQALIRGRL